MKRSKGVNSGLKKKPGQGCPGVKSQGGRDEKGKHSDKTGDASQNSATFIVSRGNFFVSAI